MPQSLERSYSGTVKQAKHPAMRWLFLLLGIVFFILGIIGLLLPVMPTAPFILLSAACWARGSKRFYLWLINHKYFGKFIRDWEERHAVPRYAKWLACIMMTLSGTMLFYQLPAEKIWMAWSVAAVFTGVGIYLWRLPDA
jgi:hypothetical protein